MKRKKVINTRVVTPALGVLAAAGMLTSARGSQQAAESTGSISRPEGSGSLLSRTSALWSNPQWVQFRKVWQKLDNFDPPPGDGYTSPIIGPGEASDLRGELYDALDDLSQVSRELGLDSMEMDFLRSVSLRRLDLLSMGSSVPLTRMAPPPGSYQMEDLLRTMEARIDTVRRLRESGILSGQEMTRAFCSLDSVVRVYFTLSVLDITPSFPRYLWQNWPEDLDMLDSHIDSLEDSILREIEASDDYPADYAESMREVFSSLRDSLARARSLLPGLHDLLMNLELI